MALALRNRPACVPTQRARKGRALLPVRVPLAPGRRQADMRVFAKEDMDFDAVLNVWAEKYEKLENKPVVIGYIIATVTAFIFVEWLIHLPALDIVLGFPLQLLGVLLAPVLAVRYLVDKKDVAGDVLDAVGELTKNLPGLDTKKN